MSALTLVGGSVIDGSGAPARRGNLVVRDGRIAAVGTDAVEGRAIDATGLVVAPGFIDLHSHAEWVALLPDGPELCAASLMQGVTTVVGGNCGISPAPLGEAFSRAALERTTIVEAVSHQLDWEWRSLAQLFAHLERRGLPFNLALLAGHGTMRASVLGTEPRPARAQERAQLAALLQGALEDGALGLSLGLEYVPGCYAPTDELAELAALLAPADALLSAHVRGISALYDEAMTEALAVAEQAGCRLQLSHVNPMGAANWSASERLLAKLRAGGGGRIGFDVVTYTGWRVRAPEVLPRPVLELGESEILARAASADGRASLRRAVEAAVPSWPPWGPGGVTRNPILELGWDSIDVVDPGLPALEHLRGSSVGALAAAAGRDPYDVYFDLLVDSGARAELLDDGYGGSVRDEAPLRSLVADPGALVGTDTVPLASAAGSVHLRQPMFWGTMPRFLGRWCREEQLFSLEDGVRRLTAAPARAAGLRDRGELRPGAPADVVAFDPRRIGDAGGPDPEPPTGIVHVLVNGEPAVRDGEYDSRRLAGQALRRAV